MKEFKKPFRIGNIQKSCVLFFLKISLFPYQILVEITRFLVKGRSEKTYDEISGRSHTWKRWRNLLPFTFCFLESFSGCWKNYKLCQSGEREGVVSAVLNRLMTSKEERRGSLTYVIYKWFIRDFLNKYCEMCFDSGKEENSSSSNSAEKLIREKWVGWVLEFQFHYGWTFGKMNLNTGDKFSGWKTEIRTTARKLVCSDVALSFSDKPLSRWTSRRQTSVLQTLKSYPKWNISCLRDLCLINHTMAKFH